MNQRQNQPIEEENLIKPFYDEDFYHGITEQERIRPELLAPRSAKITTSQFLLHTIITEPPTAQESIIKEQKEEIFNSIIRFINKEVSISHKVQNLWFDPEFRIWTPREGLKTRITMFFLFKKEVNLRYVPNQKLMMTIGPITFKFRFADFQSNSSAKGIGKAKGFCNMYPQGREHLLNLQHFMMSRDNDLGSPMLQMLLSRGLSKPEKFVIEERKQGEEAQREKEEEEKEKKDEEEVPFKCAFRKYESFWGHYHRLSNLLFDMRIALQKMKDFDSGFDQKYYTQITEMKVFLRKLQSSVDERLKNLKGVEDEFKVLWRAYEEKIAEH